MGGLEVRHENRAELAGLSQGERAQEKENPGERRLRAEK